MDQYFRSLESRSAGSSLQARNTPKLLLCVEPACGLGLSNVSTGTPKQRRNKRETEGITPKYHEGIPKQQAGSAKRCSRIPRSTGKADRAGVDGHRRKASYGLRWNASRYPEDIIGTIRVIRKRFGHPPRIHFGVTSGQLLGVLDDTQTRKPVSISVTSDYFQVIGNIWTKTDKTSDTIF